MAKSPATAQADLKAKKDLNATTKNTSTDANKLESGSRFDDADRKSGSEAQMSLGHTQEDDAELQWALEMSMNELLEHNRNKSKEVSNEKYKDTTNGDSKRAVEKLYTSDLELKDSTEKARIVFAKGYLSSILEEATQEMSRKVERALLMPDPSIADKLMTANQEIRGRKTGYFLSEINAHIKAGEEAVEKHNSFDSNLTLEAIQKFMSPEDETQKPYLYSCPPVPRTQWFEKGICIRLIINTIHVNEEIIRKKYYCISVLVYKCMTQDIYQPMLSHYELFFDVVPNGRYQIFTVEEPSSSRDARFLPAAHITFSTVDGILEFFVNNVIEQIDSNENPVFFVLVSKLNKRNKTFPDLFDNYLRTKNLLRPEFSQKPGKMEAEEETIAEDDNEAELLAKAMAISLGHPNSFTDELHRNADSEFSLGLSFDEGNSSKNLLKTGDPQPLVFSLDGKKSIEPIEPGFVTELTAQNEDTALQPEEQSENAVPIDRVIFH